MRNKEWPQTFEFEGIMFGTDAKRWGNSESYTALMYSQVHYFLNSDKIFTILALFVIAVDMKWNH